VIFCWKARHNAIQSEMFSLSQAELPTEFETTLSPEQPDEYYDTNWNTFDESVNEGPKATEAPAADKMGHQSSISVVGPQTPINWRHVPETSPPPRNLPALPPQPDAVMKGNCTGNYPSSRITS